MTTTHEELMRLADGFRNTPRWTMNGRDYATEARAALSTAIQQVLAERDQLRADRDGLHKEWEAHFGERSFGEVLAERDALAKDAARYRWLGGKATQKTAYDIWGNGGFWSIGIHSADKYMNLYEVIDAAMKGQTHD